MPRTQRRARFAALLSSFILLPASLLASGCSLLGVAASKATIIKVKPTYTGLAGQSIGVMVWADRATRVEHSALQLDIAHGVDAKLQAAAKAGADELKGTTYPPDKGPDAMFAFQRNYPSAADSMLQVAPRLGVKRLIYVEVESFELHPESVPDLSRGHLVATVQVIEVANGKGAVAYKDRVEALYPEKAPPEGLPGLDEAGVYRGAIDAFTTAVLERFVTHEEQG